MRHARLTSLILVALVVIASVGFGTPSFVHAQEPVPSVDVVLVIDDSGSMSHRWADGTREPNDPDGLRHSAAKLFVDLARPGDRLASVSFHRDAVFQGPAAQGRLTLIDGPDSRERLKSAIVQPTEPEPMERITDMRLGLRAARDLLNADPGPNERFVVFLTDGRPFPMDQVPELHQLITTYGQEGVPIFPILLGDDIDEDITNRMVQETGAQAFWVGDAADLINAYVTIFGLMRPERYSDVLDLDVGGQTSFRTTEDQSITNLSIILPKTREEPDAFADLVRDGQSVLHAGRLDDGVVITRRQADHYNVVNLSHTTALVGEWRLTARTSIAREALVLAESAAAIELLHPASMAEAARAAVRYFPAGKPPLVAVQVQQNGQVIPGLTLRAAVNGAPIELDTTGLSPDSSIYWTILDEGVGVSAGQEIRLQVQLGADEGALRLQKEFPLQSGAFPTLVVDSPTRQDNGVQPDEELLLRTRFEGGSSPQNPRVRVIIHDEIDGAISERVLTCRDNICEDRGFTPVDGRRYNIVFLATAEADGRLYSDHALAYLAMRDSLRIAGLPAVLDLGALAPEQNEVEQDLRMTAYTQASPTFNARLEMEQPGTGLQLEVAPLTAVDEDRYTSGLRLTGFAGLSPGTYRGRIVFSAGDEIDMDPPHLPLQFVIPPPEFRLRLPGTVDLGEIAHPHDPVSFSIELESSKGAPSGLTAALRQLTADGQSADPEVFNVSTSTPVRVEETDRYQMDVQVTLVGNASVGAYRGEIGFDSADGVVLEPRRVPVVFRVPQSEILLTVAGDLLEFEPTGDLTEPSSLSILARRTVVDAPPRLEARLVEARLAGAAPGISLPLDVRTGVVQPADGGFHRVPIFVSAVAELEPGVYQGTIQFTSPDGVPVRPAEMSFSVRLLTPWGMILYRLQPVGNFFRTWFWPVDPPYWTGVIGWLVLLVLINTILKLRPASARGPKGIVSGDEIGAKAPVAARESLFIVRRPEGVALSRNKRDRVQALASVTLEPRVGQRSSRTAWRPVLRRSPLAPSDVRLAYYLPSSGKWKLVGEGGAILGPGATFRVRLGKDKERYHFHYVQE